MSFVDPWVLRGSANLSALLHTAHADLEQGQRTDQLEGQSQNPLDGNGLGDMK